MKNINLLKELLLKCSPNFCETKSFHFIDWKIQWQNKLAFKFCCEDNKNKKKCTLLDFRNVLSMIHKSIKEMEE